MEENRLKPMVANYDENLFNELYRKTLGLRMKLAAQIDPHRFGVDYNEILSWFDVKFIHVFNKYYGKEANLLLGDLINALKNFRYRIMRGAYTIKYSQTIINVEDSGVLEDHAEDWRDDNYEEKKELAFSYLKDHLSENAYMLLEITIDPPLFILKQVQQQKIPSLHKIPNELFCEYLGVEPNEKGIRYIEGLRKEIKKAVVKARCDLHLN